MRIAGADGRMNDVPATRAPLPPRSSMASSYGAPVTFQKPCLGNLVVHCGKHQKALPRSSWPMAASRSRDPWPMAR